MLTRHKAQKSKKKQIDNQVDIIRRNLEQQGGSRPSINAKKSKSVQDIDSGGLNLGASYILDRYLLIKQNRS